jgi:hypothetical protein
MRMVMEGGEGRYMIMKMMAYDTHAFWLRFESVKATMIFNLHNKRQFLHSGSFLPTPSYAQSIRLSHYQ